MYSTPILVNRKSVVTQLERVSTDNSFGEEWLQKLLFDAPYSLPFGEIDPGYQHAVPLCMEMSTGAGPIDIVYITPQGRLIVVETKLFRNPEARRKVVAQILDYAKELLNWSYSDLQREVSKKTGIKGNSPYSLVREAYPDTDEATFVDGVTKSLERGDFMLIIAGDGIRRGAKAIVDFLQQTAHMRFILSMIEVSIYKVPEEEVYYIQPRVLVQTEILKRADNIMEMSRPHIEEEDIDSSAVQWRIDYKNYWDRFLDELTLDDPEQPLPKSAAAGNIFFSLPPSVTTAWINVYFKKNQHAGCFLRTTDNEYGKDIFQQLVDMKDEINAELPFEVKWDDQERRISRKYDLEEWPPFENPEAKKFQSDTINAMINVFRPRLSVISGN